MQYTTNAPRLSSAFFAPGQRRPEEEPRAKEQAGRDVLHPRAAEKGRVQRRQRPVPRARHLPEERKAHRMADRRRDSWDHMAAVHEGLFYVNVNGMSLATFQR